MRTLILLLLAGAAWAQTNQPGYGGAGGVAKGTTLPARCGVGAVYFKTDVAAGQNLYGCTSANTWTALGGAGSGDMTAAVYVTSGAGVPSNPCAAQGIQYWNTSASPRTEYYCPSAGGNWLGPVAFSLANVTNDAQTKASIVPNTTPSAGQILAGNAGGTAYAPVSISGSCTMTSAGVMTCAGGSIANASLGTGASSISRTTTAGVGGVTAKLLAAKDTSDPTRRVLPASGGCGAGIAATTATVGNTFELYVVPGTVITGVADNAITAGHVLVGGTSTPGRVRDSGQTSRTAISPGTCIVGVALQGVSSAADVLFEYDGPGTYGQATLDPTNVITGATFTFGNSIYPMGIYHNQNATAGTAVTGTLPTAAANSQFCLDNSYNGSAANTGVLTVQTSAAGQYIIYTDGTLSATGGYVSTTGAAGDLLCVVGVDSTHWRLTNCSNDNCVKH